MCLASVFAVVSILDMSDLSLVFSIPDIVYNGHSARSAGGRLQLNTYAPYICSFARSGMVHGCMVYTERAETAAVSCGTSHVSAVSTPLR